jgi:hypothetical protein
MIVGWIKMQDYRKVRRRLWERKLMKKARRG